MTREQFASAVRHLLAAFAAYAAGRGWIAEDASNEAVGAAVTLAVFAWSWIEKRSP